jgi:hypothetical protein
VLGIPSSVPSHMHYNDCTVLHNKSCSYILECNLCISQSQNTDDTNMIGSRASWTSLWIPLQLQNLDVWHRWPTLAELRLLVTCTGWVAYPHVTIMRAWWNQMGSDLIGEFNTAEVRSTISQVPTFSLMLYLFLTLPERLLSSYVFLWQWWKNERYFLIHVTLAIFY